MAKKTTPSEDQFPLALTEAERKILLGDSIHLLPHLDTIIRNANPNAPIMMPLDDLESLLLFMDDVIEHNQDKKLKGKLDKILGKVEYIIDHSVSPSSLQDDIADILHILLSGSSKQPSGKQPKQDSQKASKLTLKLTKLQREAVLQLDDLSSFLRNQLTEPASDVTDFEIYPLELNNLLASIDSAVHVGVPAALRTRLEAVAKKIDKILFPQVSGKKKSSRKTAEDAGFQLKITLEGSEPSIWRRIEVRDCTLADLHDIIQEVFGWEDCHMWLFQADRKAYGPPEFHGSYDEDTADNTLLSQIAEAKPKKFLYVYDMGDEWRHLIRVEKTLPPDPKRRLAQCLAGERAGPPEDCGGIWGYQELLEGLDDPEHDTYGEMMEWFEEGFDPAEFDLEKTNRKLKKLR